MSIEVLLHWDKKFVHCIGLGVHFCMVGGLGTTFQKPLVSITEEKHASIHSCVLQERVTHVLASEDRERQKDTWGMTM